MTQLNFTLHPDEL